MNKNSNIFERIEQIADLKGYRSVSALAKFLGYSNPEKILRLGRDENNAPSYDIIADFTNKFEDLNIRWLMTGQGEPFHVHPGVHPDVHPEVNPEVNPEHKSVVEEAGATYTRVQELEAEVDRLKAANAALIEAFKAIGEGKSHGGGNMVHKEQKSA